MNLATHAPSSRSVARWRQSRLAPLYEVSDHGQVRGENGPLTPWTDRTGYPVVSLVHGENGKRSIRVHVLVAHAFLGPVPQGMELRQVDGDKTNGALSNLAHVAVSR